MDILQRVNLQKKLLTSADPKEITEGLEDEIYKDLIMQSNHYGSYGKAIKVVESQLKLLVAASPGSKALIDAAAQKAGERFIRLVNEVRQKNQMFKFGIDTGLKFGNIKITQSPPQSQSQPSKNGGKS